MTINLDENTTRLFAKYGVETPYDLKQAILDHPEDSELRRSFIAIMDIAATQAGM